MADTACVAEFEVSRSYPIHLMEEHIFKVLIAANDQVVGYWRGGQPDVISYS